MSETGVILVTGVLKVSRFHIQFAGGTCNDLTPNCASLATSAHICTDMGARVFAQQNCARTCNLCSSMSGSGGNCHCISELFQTLYL